jgi:hypothetical protein
MTDRQSDVRSRVTDRQSLFGTIVFTLVFGGISATGCASNCPAPAPAAAASPLTPAPLAVPVVVASDPKTATTSDEVATGNTLTKFQRERLLGHYSTHDGASGFILDRTNGATWKAKLDGTTQVQPLTMTHGPYETKEYRSDDHSIWLRVDEHGSVVLFQGPGLHQGVPVVRDADANQL